ncbi:MAG TPA: GH25 family lysozyme [Verrucomicrobiae bacterium]|nr:GH25 family lysozyme [Verrucomicrobiae bacterium]
MPALTAHAQRAYGIDVYGYNGLINWTTVKNANITFAWTKATEGTYYTDTNFVNNEVTGKAAGVYMGAYDFCRPDENSPSTEANFFWNFAKNYIKNDGKTLMPMLDFETFNGVVGASSYADWVYQWCYDIQTNAAAAGVSVTPVIYCSACSGACDLTSDDAVWGAWIADYNGQNPQTGTPWSVCTSCEAWGPGIWNFWQFTSTTNVPGVPGSFSSGYCDADVFNGTASQLALAYIAGSIAVTSAPTNTTVALGGNATFKVTASTSGSQLKYQWRFDQVNIPNANTNFYTITNAQLTNAGAYSVSVTNSNGSILTTPVFLSVIAPLVNAPNSALDPSNMVNWWTADGNFYDIYGVTNLTPQNNISYTNGIVGTAFHFDGSSAYMTSSGGEIAPPWTICAWVYHQKAPTASAALCGDSTFALKIEQYNNTGEVGLSQTRVGDYVFSPAYTLPLNTWTHLAFVATSSSVTVYANGVQKGTITASNVGLPRAFFGVDTFSGSPSDFMLGAVDELQIYKRALTTAEIAAIYSAGSAGLVRAPQFTGTTNIGSGQIQLNLIGQTGKPITIKSSSDLVNWSTAATVQNNTGTTNYTDSTAAGRKFYQATQKY